MRANAVLKLVQTLDQLEKGARIACAEPDGSQSSGSPMASGSYDFTFREAEIRGVRLDRGPWKRKGAVSTRRERLPA
jgi:hypothetical protein